MRSLITLVLLLLALPEAASAAPPPNDNRVRSGTGFPRAGRSRRQASTSATSSTSTSNGVPTSVSRSPAAAVRAGARRRSTHGRVLHVPCQLAPGRYVVAVTAPFGTAGVGYRLALLIREITTTSLRLSAATVVPGAPVVLSPTVGKASAGTIAIQIDRFDPLTGWQFNRILRVQVGGTVSWRPPAERRWRLRASIRGTVDASPSRSGHVLLLVERRV